MKRNIKTVSLALMLVLTVFSLQVFGAPQDILDKWSKTERYEDDMNSELEIRATYYSSEYIEALVQNEAEKNLWTADEMENYKYELLKTLQVDQYIPVRIEIDNRGPAMHMAPFDSQISMWIGKNRYYPADYDKRFNFKLLGEREGLVFFPRYSEDGEKNLLEGVKNVKLSLRGGISSVTMRFSSMDFIWDVSKDDPSRLWSGDAAAKLEIDRLIKRINKLSQEKEELEAQLAEVNEELSDINQRIDELRRQ